jgi:hypothetical protein
VARPTCGAPRRDSTPCPAVGLPKYGGLCHWHGVAKVGEELGWRTRGNMKAGIWVADKDSRYIIADSPDEIIERMEAGGPVLTEIPG